MSRTLSSTVLAAIYSQETDKIFLHLLTIDHPDLAVPVRLVNNTEDIVSRRKTYTAFPFQIVIPPEVEGELPSVQLVVDNVSQLLIADLRRISSPPTVDLEVIVADDPDIVEASFNFTLKAIDYDQFAVVSQLAYEDILTEPFPEKRFTPTIFPGMF